MSSPNHIWAGLNTVTELAKQEDVDECFQSVSEGKSLIASAITGKGVSTSSTATFQTMANNIQRLTTVSGSVYEYATFTGYSGSTTITASQLFKKAASIYAAAAYGVHRSYIGVSSIYFSGTTYGVSGSSLVASTCYFIADSSKITLTVTNGGDKITGFAIGRL